MNETGHRFEDRLWEDLVADHGSSLAGADRPTPHRRPHRIRWAGAGTLATIAALIGLFLAGSGSPAAFAVTSHADGSVTVSLRNVEAVKAANAELHRLHAHVVIVAAGAAPACRFVTAPWTARRFPVVEVAPRLLVRGLGTITVPKLSRSDELITFKPIPNGHQLVLKGYAVRGLACGVSHVPPISSTSVSTFPASNPVRSSTSP